jgi:hypothetical protein
MDGGDGGMLNLDVSRRAAPQAVHSQIEFNYTVFKLGGFDD